MATNEIIMLASGNGVIIHKRYHQAPSGSIFYMTQPMKKNRAYLINIGDDRERARCEHGKKIHGRTKKVWAATFTKSPTPVDQVEAGAAIRAALVKEGILTP